MCILNVWCLSVCRGPYKRRPHAELKLPVPHANTRDIVWYSLAARKPTSTLFARLFLLVRRRRTPLQTTWSLTRATCPPLQFTRVVFCNSASAVFQTLLASDPTCEYINPIERLPALTCSWKRRKKNASVRPEAYQNCGRYVTTVLRLI